MVYDDQPNHVDGILFGESGLSRHLHILVARHTNFTHGHRNLGSLHRNHSVHFGHFTLLELIHFLYRITAFPRQTNKYLKYLNLKIMKNLIVTSYIIYLPLALFLTLVVAKIFFRNSRIFMSDIFHGRSEIAKSTNTMLEMGFYLLSIGYAFFIMEINWYQENIFEVQDAFEALSTKVGALSVFLGFMVFGFLFLLFRGKRKSAQSSQNSSL